VTQQPSTAAIRIGTRTSELALRQARMVQAALVAQGLETELVTFKTIGAKGLFTKEHETALLKKKIDVAVHSLKDLPTESPEGLHVGAVLEREDPRDALVVNGRVLAASLDEIPRGSRVGTSSLRRRAQLLAARPDLEVAELRGNVPTRLMKIDEGRVHAAILAAAGLHRLGAKQHITCYLDAPAIQTRLDDERMRGLVEAMNHAPTMRAVTAERAFLAALEGGCQVPIGALSVETDGASTLHGMIADINGVRVVRGSVAVDDADPALSGIRLANQLRGEGASDILEGLRRTPALRALVRETMLAPSQLVLPLFVRSGSNVRQPVSSMPGVAQTSVDQLLVDARDAAALGVGGVLLFGIPDTKDAVGSGAWDDDGPVPQAVRALKKELPQLVVITDVCMCEYTDHGHCGIVRDGDVDNDATLALLVNESLAHARAGADIVAPSDMMDGRVGAIRRGLDAGGFQHTAILSYAAKFASAFYGPFREAAESTPQSGDRRGYQMDVANASEAIRETLQDIEEGTDMVMVKPAGPFLDIVSRVKTETGYPLAAYQVSGEFAMIHAAADRGWIELERAMMESLIGIRRAGADIVITYFAREAARALGRIGG
jgi:porphobilinogen synthase